MKVCWPSGFFNTCVLFSTCALQRGSSAAPLGCKRAEEPWIHTTPTENCPQLKMPPYIYELWKVLAFRVGKYGLQPQTGWGSQGVLRSGIHCWFGLFWLDLLARRFKKWPASSYDLLSALLATAAQTAKAASKHQPSSGLLVNMALSFFLTLPFSFPSFTFSSPHSPLPPSRCSPFCLLLRATNPHSWEGLGRAE